MSLFERNIHELESIASWANDNGCGSIKINLITSSGRAEKMKADNELLATERLIEIGRWVMTELQSKLDIKIYYSMPPAFWSVASLLALSTPTCNIHSILGILPTGQLSMCGIGYVESALIYGKIGVDNVSDIWANHSVILSIREDLPQNMKGICANCVHKETCLGLCAANNYHRTRDLTQSFEFCEQAYEKGLFPRTRMITQPI
jgi:radical SAM protein with 4Fe4S-binding SPASM domain